MLGSRETHNWNPPVNAAPSLVVAFTLAGLAMGACTMAATPSPPAGPTGTFQSMKSAAVGAPAQKWRASAVTVVGSATNQARLCVGPVTATPTPDCAGPAVTPWDWANVRSTISGQARWGIFDLTGTWDGSRFTLVEPPARAQHLIGVQTSKLPTCSTPSGGWVAPNLTMVGDDDLAAAQAAAQRIPSFAAMWLRTPAQAKAPVLHVAVTRAAAAAEQEIRKHWGGPLCIFPALRTHADLSRIEAKLRSGAFGTEILMSSISLDHVSITVLIDPTSALQARVHQEFGSGVVQIDAILKAVR